jgi:hypothetical protein
MSANIYAKDSHCHDIVLITTPTTKGFCRRNLHDTDFESMASDHATPSTIDNANLGFQSTPLSCLVTHSQQFPHSAPSVLQQSSVKELQVPHGIWHLRRTGVKHKRP